MLVFRAGIHKFLVRVATREDPDLSLPYLSGPFRQVASVEILEHLPYSLPAKKAQTNSADPDRTASAEAVLSRPFLFAILMSILWIPALITNI